MYFTYSDKHAANIPGVTMASWRISFKHSSKPTNTPLRPKDQPDGILWRGLTMIKTDGLLLVMSGDPYGVGTGFCVWKPDFASSHYHYCSKDTVLTFTQE